jgi:hypothetical protein
LIVFCDKTKIKIDVPVLVRKRHDLVPYRPIDNYQEDITSKPR